VDKGKLVRLVLIPIIIGLVVTLIIRQVLSPADSVAGSADMEMVSVVVVASKETVPAKTRLTEQHLAVKQVPTTILSGTEFPEVKDVAGQMTAVPLEPGEVVLRHRVVPEGKGSLAYRIPAGFRAITIRIDELTGVAGHPEPGDLVDLILVLQAKEPDRKDASARLIYEGVEVLGKGPVTPDAAGGAVQTGETGKLTSLTLAMKPEHAVEIALAEQIGLLKVTLRPAQKEGNAGRLLFKEDAYKQ
jgi:pilus assembly protein CpaB